MKVIDLINALTQAPEYYDYDIEIEGGYGAFGMGAMIILSKDGKDKAVLEDFEELVERLKEE